MAAFDQSWWDVRTMHLGKFDTSGLAQDGATYIAWMRWRLVDELLQRFYNDIGLEPGFGLIGTELYQVALYSPTCRRAPRYFGRLCGTGLHPAHDDDYESPLDGIELAPANIAHRTVHEGSWTTWSQYRQEAIRVLGLAHAGVDGHEGCFHRRGKALTALMYRVGLLLRTNGGYELMPMDDAMLTVADRNDSHASDIVQIRDVIERAGGTIPAGPPRYLGVHHEVYQWVALRTDGWVATPAGPIDAAGLWRSGANEEEIAGAINEICMS